MLRNDDPVGVVLRKAYEVPALSEGAREKIRRAVVSSPPPRRNPMWRFALAGSGIAAALFVGAPVARANYLGYSLAAKIRDARPFTVTIMTGDGGRSRPLVATVAGGVCILSEPGPGTDTVYQIEPNRMVQLSPSDGKAVVREVDSGWLRLLALPDQIAAQLAHFRLTKQVRSRGNMRVEGRELESVEIESGGSFSKVLLDLDPKTGVPVQMRLGMAPGLGVTTFRYDRQEDKARQVVARAEAAFAAAPKVDIEKSQRMVASSRPLKQIQLGRDVLSIYRVERNRRGDIFVLYTSKGYHGSEERQGNWLRLEDMSGRQWPSDVVSFSFAKFRLEGQYPKAQVFFSPNGELAEGGVKLFSRMREWGFIPSHTDPPLSEAGTRRVEFGAFVPAKVTIGQPDWVYGAFNFNDPNWLIANARKLRFIEALRRGNYTAAKKVGLALEADFPEMMSGFFYDRKQLSLGLYRVFRETGEITTARKYLRDAMRRSEKPFGKELEALRKREGL